MSFCTGGWGRGQGMEKVPGTENQFRFLAPLFPLTLVKREFQARLGRRRSMMPNVNGLTTRVAGLPHFTRLVMGLGFRQQSPIDSGLKQLVKSMNSPEFFSTWSRASQVESGVASTTKTLSQLPVDKV